MANVFVLRNVLVKLAVMTAAVGVVAAALLLSTAMMESVAANHLVICPEFIAVVAMAVVELVVVIPVNIVL